MLTQAGIRNAADVVRQTQVSQAPNGVCYSATGDTAIAAADLERLVGTVPRTIAAALKQQAYYFVPLAVGEGDETLVAEQYDVALSDRAVCHRNVSLGKSQCVFISTRLMDDKFSVAFEFFINIGHGFVEEAGVSEEFAQLAWKQVEAGARGETSVDANESRRRALPRGQSREGSGELVLVDEKAKTGYLNAAFSDAIAIYLLSLYLDVDYYDLREREYPLLAPAPLAERLRKIAELFPPNAGYEFSIYYRRRP